MNTFSQLISLNMALEDEIKQKFFKSEFHKAAINIIYTFNWLDANHKEFFNRYDLTSQQFNILRILRGQYPKPSTINLLKERMLDKMSDASRIVERLRLKKLLERHTCPNDRRAVDIVISQKGLDLLEKIDSESQDMDRVLAKLTKDEAKQLNLLLDKIRS